MRVVVIANKYWEADPLVNVLLADGNREGESSFARPPDPTPGLRRALGRVEVSGHPVLVRPTEPRTGPRAVWQLEKATVEVWCLQDLMGNVVGEEASSTERKGKCMPGIFEKELPELVIAVGTAAHPESALAPGSVVVGRRLFVHDSNGERPQPNPKSSWPPAWRDEVLDTVLGADQGFTGEQFSAWQKAVAGAVEARFLRAPLRPADVPLLVSSDRYVSVATVNVTDYRDYAWADLASLDAFRRVQRGQRLTEQVGSVETTHAVIGLEAMRRNARFVWVSGIANSAGHFNAQVGQRTHAHNFVAAHNAGIAVAWMVPEMVKALFPKEKS